MTSKIDNIISDGDISFNSIPNVGTVNSTDNSSKLASYGYLISQGLSDSTYFSKNTQTITGIYTFVEQLYITNLDRYTSGNITIGQSTDSSLTFSNVTLTIKTFLQNLSNYILVGNTNITTTTGNGVNVQKVQTGRVSIASSATVNVTFSPAFSGKPSVQLGLQNTTIPNGITLSRWASNVSTTGFTINCSSTSSTAVVNWSAWGN